MFLVQTTKRLQWVESKSQIGVWSFMCLFNPTQPAQVKVDDFPDVAAERWRQRFHCGFFPFLTCLRLPVTPEEHLQRCPPPPRRLGHMTEGYLTAASLLSVTVEFYSTSSNLKKKTPSKLEMFVLPTYNMYLA